MRYLNRDEIFEALVILHTDKSDFGDVVSEVMGRSATPEEIKAADTRIAELRSDLHRAAVRPRHPESLGLLKQALEIASF